MTPKKRPMKHQKKQKRPTFREIADKSPVIQQNIGVAIAALALIVLAFAALLIHGIVNALR